MQVKLPFHVVDLAAEEVRTASGEHVDIRPRSYAVLRLLAENAGRLVGKDDIMTKVWDDVAVTEDSLTQCIADIRKAIGDDERRVLRTVSRKGYMLVPAQPAATKPERTPDQASLAVMPFISIGEGQDEMLGIGVATEIIGELACNRDLRLIARDSSFAMAGQNLMAQELGTRLGARYLVEGTASRAGDELLVDVQLVDAADGTINWGDRFSARARDIPSIRREIAAKIATSLHSGMRQAEKLRSAALPEGTPLDLDVYKLTLRGFARKHQFHPEATRAGRRDLEFRRAAFGCSEGGNLLHRLFGGGGVCCRARNDGQRQQEHENKQELMHRRLSGFASGFRRYGVADCGRVSATLADRPHGPQRQYNLRMYAENVHCGAGEGTAWRPIGASACGG